jgi:diguanylate cyclase (GGDEF)-like protein/PAS domain S-box-containing protein
MHDDPGRGVGVPSGRLAAGPSGSGGPGVVASSVDGHRLLAAVDVGVMVYDRAGRIVDANPAALALIGRDLRDIVGRPIQPREPMSIRPDGSSIPLDELPVARAMRSGSPAPASQIGLRRPDGTLVWLMVTACPLVEDGITVGAVATLSDHTARHEVEQAERTVSSAMQVLVRAVDEQSLLRDMCDTIVASGGYALAWVVRAEDDAARTVSVLARAGDTDDVADGLVSWSLDEARGRGLVGTCLREATVQVCGHLATDPRLEPWRERLSSFGFASSASIPFELGDGARGCIVIHSREVHAFDQRAIGLLGTLARDLEYGLRHLRTTEALAASEERFRLLAENTGDVVLLSRDGVIEWVSPSVEGALGWDPLDLVGRVVGELVHPAEERATDLARTEGRGGVPSTHRGRIRRADGTWTWVDARTRPVLGPGGRPDGSMITTLWDTTAEVTAQEALAHAASHDALTGLANRSLLLAELDQALAASRRSGEPVAVLLLDLDHFKYVNDSLGHSVGDALLCTAAERMTAAVRDGDLVARPGGDEFVVVMRGLGDPSEALVVAERLMEAFRSPIVVGDAELFTTASVGLAVATTAEHDAVDLLREADTAMYRAKEEGRDRLSLFNEDLRESVTRRLRLGTELRTALERGELAVWFQPEVDLDDGDLRAVEALLRWHHPTGEVHSAQHFIETAEDTGMILDIGRWALEQACLHAARWLSDRPGHPLVVRVNLSSLQLAEAGLLTDLDRALERAGLDPTRLCLEITETAMLHETGTVRANMAGIHRRGVGMAIDDFGTGYASLTYLRRYPVDVVKLDRSFVQNLGTVPQDEHITAGIIDLARRLGISVTAEGVERVEQAEVLRSLGCSSAQGFLYSPAVPPEVLEPMLDDPSRLV